MLEGLLDSDAAKKFITPLNDIIKVGITEKILLNVTEDGLKISCSTPNKSNFVILKYKPEILSGFTFPTVPFNFGIKDLSELVGIMRVFNDGFKIKVEDGILTLSSGTSIFTYYGCAEKHCIIGPKNINIAELKPYTTFKWSDELKTFGQSINQLRDQEHIVISGNLEDAVTTLMVTNNQFKRYNNFTCKVNCTPVSETYRKIIDKNIFHPVVTSSVETFVVKVLNEAVMFFGNTEDFTIIHAVSTKIK